MKIMKIKIQKYSVEKHELTAKQSPEKQGAQKRIDVLEYGQRPIAPAAIVRTVKQT